MFTKANSGANNPRLGMSDEKNAKSPGFLKKIAKVGKWDETHYNKWD